MLADFIRAFDDLDGEHFRLAFDDNATVFDPRALPQRGDGRAEFEKAFKTVFPQIRGGSGAPGAELESGNKNCSIKLPLNAIYTTKFVEATATLKPVGDWRPRA